MQNQKRVVTSFVWIFLLEFLFNGVIRFLCETIVDEFTIRVRKRSAKHVLWQRWSPRGHILKSLASKVKSLALASRPQVLENWPVLGSRTALFFELLKFWEALENFYGKRCFVEIAWKIVVKTFFFWRALALALVFLVLGLGLEHSCPWPRECLSSERLSLALASDFFCVLGLEPCVLDSTSVLWWTNAEISWVFASNHK